jgi:hypothetical protein
LLASREPHCSRFDKELVSLKDRPITDAIGYFQPSAGILDHDRFTPVTSTDRRNTLS